MKIITDRQEVLDVFDSCREAGIALFAPNGELPAEMEGLCMGAQRLADEHGIAQIPVAIGMTGNYPENAQFRKVSTACAISEDAATLEGGDVRQGAEIWFRQLACYEDLLDYFPAVRVLPFVDHGWAVGDLNDEAILFDDGVVDRMAIIMYDATPLPVEENARLTAQYVERYGKRVVVEAACDEIYAPADIARLGLTREDQLSKSEKVEWFVKQTGVDLIVPNIGTEHRSVAKGVPFKRYERQLAQDISGRVGRILALHGSSSLGGDVGTTAQDGICKINFYTAMAVGAGNKLWTLLQEHRDAVMEQRDLQINSETWSHDIRRRHVAEVCHQMMTTIGYEKLVG